MPFLPACEAARSKFPYHAFVCHTRGSDDSFSSPDQAPAYCEKISDNQNMPNECTGSFLFSVAERFGRIPRARSVCDCVYGKVGRSPVRYGERQRPEH